MVSFIVLLPSSVQPNVNYVVKLKLWLEKSTLISLINVEPGINVEGVRNLENH